MRHIRDRGLAASRAAGRRAVAVVRARLAVLHHDQRGYTTEQVIVTALLAALAIGVVGIIAKIVTDWANSLAGPG